MIKTFLCELPMENLVYSFEPGLLFINFYQLSKIEGGFENNFDFPIYFSRNKLRRTDSLKGTN